LNDQDSFYPCWRFNDYYISEILAPLTAWRASEAGAADRDLMMYSDNARPQIRKKPDEFFANNGMRRPPHSPYSHDFAPSDFFLFGYIKNKLKRQLFDDPDHLF
jgi:hypothetical protein